MHLYFNDFCDFGEEDELFSSAESHRRALTIWCNTHAHKPYNTKFKKKSPERTQTGRY